jgi:shikimate dehydrogenase
MASSSGPRRGAAVLGSPIAHSLSPTLHHAAYDVLGLEGWRYDAIECGEGDLADRLRELDAEGAVGASLTMPLKRAVMPMLSAADDVATLVGVANTVLFTDAGWRGANTDVPGMITALRPRLLTGRSGQTACVLGAGATACAAIAALARLGFTQVAVFARRPMVVYDLESWAATLGVSLAAHGWDEIASAQAAPVVVSTVPAAATTALADAVSDPPGVLFDVIYSPWPTPLAQAWELAGGVVIGGLELLVEQAALQVELMTGHPAPIAAMRAAGKAALAGT